MIESSMPSRPRSDGDVPIAEKDPALDSKLDRP
jgi:hypothetical protein